MFGQLAGLGCDLHLYALGSADGDGDERRFGRFLRPFLVRPAKIGSAAVDLEPDGMADGTPLSHSETEGGVEGPLQSGESDAIAPHQDTPSLLAHSDADDEGRPLEVGSEDVANLDLFVRICFQVLFQGFEALQNKANGCERLCLDVLHGVPHALARDTLGVPERGLYVIFFRISEVNLWCAPTRKYNINNNFCQESKYIIGLIKINDYKNQMRILGIETSCDETSAAVVENDGRSFEVKSNIVSSQIKIHAKYGGVVPEVAARKHVEAILPVVDEALRQAQGIKYKDIDAIAVASGPGLITSLLVGNETAKILSWFREKPLVALNHMEAHIYANWLTNKKINFPALCLVVSGGHTELVLMRGHGKYKVIGETRDDAAGECFDKTAKILGLGYPGGPAVAAAAARFQISDFRFKIELPRPMIATKDFDFSFSGLKTAVLYAARDLLKKYKMEEIVPAMAYEIQEAIVDVLIAKTIWAAKKHNVKIVMLAGGVSANKRLRERFVDEMKNELPNTKYQIPDTKYCTDNAAMVAAAGYFHAIKKDFTPWHKLKVDPNWSLG